MRGGAGRPGTNARPGTEVAAAQAGERGSRGTPGRRRSEIGEVSERRKGNSWGGGKVSAGWPYQPALMCHR